MVADGSHADAGGGAAGRGDHPAVVRRGEGGLDLTLPGRLAAVLQAWANGERSAEAHLGVREGASRRGS